MMVETKLIYKTPKGVNLLKIALPITGQWVTDNVSIKLYMLYNQILRLKIGLWGGKNFPIAGNIAIGAS